MDIVCLDLEGVLVPEIWIAFAEESGIPELKKTTRDDEDILYDELTKTVYNKKEDEQIKAFDIIKDNNI